MDILYGIKADIIDVRIDKPQRNEAFLIDTNVLFWWFYPGAISDENAIRAKRQYDPYLKRLREVRARLFYATTALLEIAHTIEATALIIYKQTQGS